MATHDLLDGLGSLVGVVEWDGRHIVMQDVGLDNAVQQLATDEAELAVDGRGRTADVVPRLGGVMRERRVGVLEEGDGD